MVKPRRLFALASLTLLVLAGSTAFAGGPWFRGGAGGHRGGRGSERGPVWGGEIRSRGFHRYGGLVRVLPRGYVTTTYLGNPYYFGEGHWYRPWRGGYLGFYPPIGLRLAILPLGYRTYVYRELPYFYYEDVYYSSAPEGGYVVVAPPPEALAEAKPAQPPVKAPEAAGDALLIIPLDGQDEARMMLDRERAQRYAVEESGYDPADAKASDPAAAKARRAYFRAMKTFLEERGYSVK